MNTVRVSQLEKCACVAPGYAHARVCSLARPPTLAQNCRHQHTVCDIRSGRSSAEIVSCTSYHPKTASRPSKMRSFSGDTPSAMSCC